MATALENNLVGGQDTEFETFMRSKRNAVQLPDENTEEMDDQKYMSFPVVTNSFPTIIKISPERIVHKYDIRFESDNFDPTSSAKQEHLALIEGEIRAHLDPNDSQPVLLSYDAERLNTFADRVENFSITYNGITVRFEHGQENQWFKLKKQHQMSLAHNFLKPLLHEVGLEKMTRDYYDSANIQNVASEPDLQFIQGYRLSLENTADFLFSERRWSTSMVLTVDPCYRILSKLTVLEKLMRLKEMSKTEKDFRKRAIKELKNESFVCLQLKKARAKMKVSHIDFENNIDTYMLVYKKTGETISLREYIQREHGVGCSSNEKGIIIYKHDPKHGQTEETADFEAFPPEFCKITGKPEGIRRNVRKCRELANKCKLDAADRQRRIVELVENLQQAVHDVEGFDEIIEIESEVKSVQGRLLNEEKVKLGQGKNRGKRSITMSELQKDLKRSVIMGNSKLKNSLEMKANAKLSNNEWLLVYQKKKEKSVKKMVKKMCEYPPTKGLLGPKPIVHALNTTTQKAWLEGIAQKVEENESIRAVVIVLPPEGKEADELYAALKNLCTSELGIVTQCVKCENILDAHVQEGITRQLFTKLGVKGLTACIPWKLEFVHTDALGLNKPTMLVGLDVNQNKGSQKSAIGMVSSFDRDFVNYHSQLDWQTAKQEEMDTNKMQEMMTNALRNFENRNYKKWPEQVILFRDGVAEGQMEKIYRQEIEGIRKAFKNTHPDCNPKLLYIVTQKRVNARFMFAKDGGMFNVPLGTIVDNGVVSSGHWDWYMVPAKAPDGCTSTPTRFIVIVDDMGIGQDPEKVLALEYFTKQLCNLYFNWSGPVRIPSCVKNADKLSQQFGSKIGPKSNNYGKIHEKLSCLYHYL